MRLTTGRALIALAMCAICSCGQGSDNIVHVLGRDYIQRGEPVPLEQATAGTGDQPIIVKDGKIVSGHRGQYQPTAIYVERDGKYVPYDLEGGP